MTIVTLEIRQSIYAPNSEAQPTETFNFGSRTAPDSCRNPIPSKIVQVCVTVLEILFVHGEQTNRHVLHLSGPLRMILFIYIYIFLCIYDVCSKFSYIR